MTTDSADCRQSPIGDEHLFSYPWHLLSRVSMSWTCSKSVLRQNLNSKGGIRQGETPGFCKQSFESKNESSAGVVLLQGVFAEAGGKATFKVDCWQLHTKWSSDQFRPPFTGLLAISPNSISRVRACQVGIWSSCLCSAGSFTHQTLSKPGTPSTQGDLKLHKVLLILRTCEGAIFQRYKKEVQQPWQPVTSEGFQATETRMQPSCNSRGGAHRWVATTLRSQTSDQTRAWQCQQWKHVSHEGRSISSAFASSSYVNSKLNKTKLSLTHGCRPLVSILALS